ncbi:glycosyltransferase family 1 protein [Burkholderia sp. Tr-860]|uniref:glycosyltransferase family 4 protein n=1 Tax=unclassified Burkholderia TaxID=2613784 RepID=UPI0031F4B280
MPAAMPSPRILLAAALMELATWCHRPATRLARRAVQAVAPRDAGLAVAGRARELLVDVSIIAKHDAGTGIQRVVRSLLRQLIEAPPPGFVVRPVLATRKLAYRYADDYLASFGAAPIDTGRHRLDPRSGDIFLGLDLTSRILPRRQFDFLAWKAKGVRLTFVVYDVLPAHHPQWFTARGNRSFRHWFSTIAIHADSLISIARTTRDAAAQLMQSRFAIDASSLPIRHFPLGCDIDDRAPDRAGASARETRARSDGPTIIMVGTIEPRKGHALVIDAFETRWRETDDPARLVIIGRLGWGMDAFAARLAQRCAASAGKLSWIDDADDDCLAEMYRQADGLVFASEAEGYGLPIVEAAHYGIPLLLRDLPIFHEIAGEHASYFTAANGDELAGQLAGWLARLDRRDAPDSASITPLTWRDSAAALKNLLASR